MSRMDHPDQPSERVESEHHRSIEKLQEAAGEQGSKHKEIAAKTAEHVSSGKLPNLQIEGMQHVNPFGKEKAPDKPEPGSEQSKPGEHLTPSSNTSEGQAKAESQLNSPQKGDHFIHNGNSDSGAGNTTLGDSTSSQNSAGATTSGTPNPAQ